MEWEKGGRRCRESVEEGGRENRREDMLTEGGH